LWPWAIEVHTLGRFELRRDGKPVEFSGRVQRKPLDLLKALLALGGKDAREETLTDMVWPEASGDAAHHSLEVTLQRLRALLGHPEALQLRDGRLTLHPQYCWVDLWVFDHFLGQVMREGMADRAVHAAQMAMEMYGGHFLAGEADEPWVSPLRERLRSKFLGNVKWLGHHHEQAGRWREALECYQKGLEIDDLAEELYRRLMTCHHRLGQKGEALSIYYRCKKTLHLVFGIAPSSETERLYRTIRESA
jgi:DNA-binding SARP family transcriptional activator